MKFAYTLTFCVPLLVSPVPAMATAVYAGCSVPALKSGHHTFYVDPVNGSMSGDGSSARPWSTLAEVVSPTNKLVSTQAYSNKTRTYSAINPTAPIKAGDLILLRSGDHGSVRLLNMFNTDFITVTAAPGATPIVDAMAVVSSGKWMFQGISFQGMATTATGATSANPSPNNLVTAGRGDYTGQTTDIVFSYNSFSAAESTAGWTNYDWVNKPYSQGLWAAAPCVTAIDNHFYNLMNGLFITAPNSLVQGNLIESVVNDGIDIVSSNLLIKNNTIRNGVNNAADPYHADGIQGWSGTVDGVPNTNTNVVIDGNMIIKTGDPAVSYMQGISIFDGKWNNLVIINNVVDVNTWNGIAVWGTQNSKIVNNSVIASNPAGAPSWIQIHSAKDGTVPNGVVVRNNIATTVMIGDSNTVVDHNIATLKITMPVDSKPTTATNGIIGNANSVLPTALKGFLGVNVAENTYSLQLRSSSPAVGYGVATDAPATDIVRRSRTAPVDAGAYVWTH